jgi:large subunit ribosomal protein L32
MAVQQNKKSPARRNNRRSHDKLSPIFLSDMVVNGTKTGEKHRRHHISLSGKYRGKQVIS